MSIEAMKQALSALDRVMSPGPAVQEAITALRAAIEQAEKPRQWHGLTDDEIRDCFQQRHNDKVIERRWIAEEIEAKLLEKNTRNETRIGALLSD